MGDARIVRAAVPDAVATAPRVVSEKKRRSQKRHSGRELVHFLEMAQRGQKQARATVPSLRDRHGNLNVLKSVRRVCTLATCLSTQPKAIFLSCSTESDHFKMRKSEVTARPDPQKGS